MRAKIVSIGTSRGIRIPKLLLNKYNFETVVEIDDTGERLFIHPVTQPREGWTEAFDKALKSSSAPDNIVMPSSQWDDEEWEWK